MLQISSASLEESRILQVARANIFALPVCLCIFAGLYRFAVLRWVWRMEAYGIEAGAAEIKRFYFCCNWEKGAPSVSHLGLLLQILISIFPLFSLLALWNIEWESLTNMHTLCVFVCVFAHLLSPCSPQASIINCAFNIWMWTVVPSGQEHFRSLNFSKQCILGDCFPWVSPGHSFYFLPLFYPLQLPLSPSISPFVGSQPFPMIWTTFQIVCSPAFFWLLTVGRKRDNQTCLKGLLINMINKQKGLSFHNPNHYFMMLLNPQHALNPEQNTTFKKLPAICAILLVHSHHMRPVLLVIPMHVLLSI